MQIGNAITEKMLLDVILQARDRGLYHRDHRLRRGRLLQRRRRDGREDRRRSVARSGAAEVRRACRTPKSGFPRPRSAWCWPCRPRTGPSSRPCVPSEGVEATVIGRFDRPADCSLRYRRPAGRRPEHGVPARWPAPMSSAKRSTRRPAGRRSRSPTSTTGTTPTNLLRILGSLNVCSKEWIIRQYDHEVQGGSVVKPLVGVSERRTQRRRRGAARARPRSAASSSSCGMNPRYGDFDPYHMAASAIDEAVRNCVAVGADPRRIAILDNFCWGDCQRPETLGSLVRAALACRDLAIACGTPFISGKDSLNNEFRYQDADGVNAVDRHSALAADQCAGANRRRAAGRDDGPEGSRQLALPGRRDEGRAGRIALRAGRRAHRRTSAARSIRPVAPTTFAALHAAIDAGLVRACHDLSEGGLAVAAAEMAFAGALVRAVVSGAIAAPDRLDAAAREKADRLAARFPAEEVPAVSVLPAATAMLLFAESNTRFLCEVRPEHTKAFEAVLAGVPCAAIGEVVDSGLLEIVGLPAAVRGDGDSSEPGELLAPLVIRAELATLKDAWQKPLAW